MYLIQIQLLLKVNIFNTNTVTFKCISNMNTFFKLFIFIYLSSDMIAPYLITLNYRIISRWSKIPVRL